MAVAMLMQEVKHPVAQADQAAAARALVGLLVVRVTGVLAHRDRGLAVRVDRT